MGTAITGSALPFFLQMPLALPTTDLWVKETGGSEGLVFPPQARLARIFISSAGQESASACCSVRAARSSPLHWGGRDTVQGLATSGEGLSSLWAGPAISLSLGAKKLQCQAAV